MSASERKADIAHASICTFIANPSDVNAWLKMVRSRALFVSLLRRLEAVPRGPTVQAGRFHAIVVVGVAAVVLVTLFVMLIAAWVGTLTQEQRPGHAARPCTSPFIVNENEGSPPCGVVKSPLSRLSL